MNDIFQVCAVGHPPSVWAYSICLSDLSADVRGAKFPILFDAERCPRQKEQRGEALRTAPVSPLAWYVVYGETQSRGTNMAEYKEG